MSIDPLYLVYGAIFVAALLFVDGLYHWVLDSRTRSGRNLNRRMQMLSSGARASDVLSRLRKDPDKQGFFSMLGTYAAFERLIIQSGITLSTGQMVGVMAGLGAVTLVMASVAGTVPPGPGVLLGFVVGTVFPIMYLRIRRSNRKELFEEQLPEALDVMVRSLRAGHPISSSVALVAREMPDPIGTEFGIALDETTFGLDLVEALQRLGARTPSQDLHYMITAISIQRGTGGNLAEILSALSSVIRDRFRMFKKIKALSAEGRISATVISALPFLVVGALNLLQPAYFARHWGNPLFLTLLGAGFAALVLGIVIMYKMVKFRV